MLVYSPALSGGFIWDDDYYVTQNPLLTAPDGWHQIWFSAHSQSQFFPLAFSTLRLEYDLWTLHPFGYHLVNVLMHAVNSILLWRVLKTLAVPGALWAAALFALHPVQVESVAWVAEIKNLESTSCYLLAVLAWLRFIGPAAAGRWRFYGFTLVLYVLALAAKTTACTLPAALLLVLWFQRRTLDWRVLLQVTPFVMLGVAAGILSIWWEAHLGNYREDVGQGLTLVQRMLIASHALWFYSGKLVWPVNLTFSYPHWQVNPAEPADYLWMAGGLLLAVILGVAWKKTGSRAIAGVLFFAAALLPMLGFIPLYTFRYAYVADHYQYLACAGLFTVAAAGFDRIPRTVPLLVLSALAFLTWRQAHIYHDSLTLWQDALAKNPSSWMAHENLGLVLKQEGQLEEAAGQYEQCIRLKPDGATGHYDLGIVLFEQGKTGPAMAELRQAVQLAPRDSTANYNYAVALDGAGHEDEAIDQYQQAIRSNPAYFEAHLNLGLVFSRRGRANEALAEFQAAVRLAPNDAEARNDLGAVLRAKLRLADAVEQFRQAVRLQPDHALAHANLGATLLQQGQLDEAITELQTALHLDPNNADARKNLASALAGRNALPAR